MRILFINPPNGINDANYLAPPLGLLTLASFVRQFNYEVEIVDLNLEIFADKTLDDEHFYQKSCELISEKNPDIVGFTSMCLESHVSLEIARQIKSRIPNIKTIFGGTHFGAIANELLEKFDFVDYVITGEGEHALISILDKEASAKMALPENVTYRFDDKILKGVTEVQRFALEEIPFPAYDLVELEKYFGLNPVHLFNYEAGRGCVFKCSFCYSPFHYGDHVRNKSPDKVVVELANLVELGARHIFFVQDNFLNSPRWASELCISLADADLPLTWECYSTYPQLKSPIIELLSKAGCIGVFTGIDAVSISSQKRMNKPFLRDWKKTSSQLTECLTNGILPMCAFILEEPDQDIEKTDSTIYTALECVKLGCEIHLNTLSLYNGTALARGSSELEFQYSAIKPELLLDTPKVVQNNKFAKNFPELFPYHSTYCKVDDWEIFASKSHTLLTLILGLPETLFRFVVDERKSLWRFLGYIENDFVEWMRNLDVFDRREAAAFEFARNFSLQPLSESIRSLFHIELANVILSAKKEPRSVTISVNGINSLTELSWFVNFETFKIFDDFSRSDVLNSLKGQTFSNAVNSIPARDDHHVALLLKDKKSFRVNIINSELWDTLSSLEYASNTNTVVPLTDAEKENLMENQWLIAQHT